MQAWIVTDLGFGDGGKGTTTDTLTRHLNTKCVVKYIGGAQAAHTVITPEGKQHTFHQFGSGTFAGNVKTFLSRFVLVNPLALWAEARDLEKLGVVEPFARVHVDRSALVTSPYHVAANRIREFARGANRHGSCGLGIGETMADSIAHPDQVLRVADIVSSDFTEKLAWHRQYKQAELAETVARLRAETSLPPLIEQALEQLESDDEFEAALEVYAHVLQRCVLVDSSFLAETLQAGPVVFEGSQGILLDENWGFHPHTTWSTTTSHNARELVRETGLPVDTTTVGVMRAYQTRHGNGPLPTEDEALSSLLSDPNNPTNPWQGEFRFGWLDLALTRYALTVNEGVDYLAVTCLDDLSQLKQLWVSDGYKQMRDLPIGRKGDLAHQEKLGKTLTQAQPILRKINSSPCYAEQIADDLGVPLGITSLGPRSDQKEIWIN